MIGSIVQGLGYGLAAAAQPGPFQTYVISRTLAHGWRRTLPAALAPLISDVPVIALSILLLRRVPAWFERVLNIAGGILVVYLAWRTFAAWRGLDGKPGHAGLGSSGGILGAALANLLSPGPWLFWTLVTGPLLVSAWRQNPALGIGFLLAFYAAMVGTLGALILLFGAAGHLGPRANRVLLVSSAIALVFFGAAQLWRGVGG